MIDIRWFSINIDDKTMMSLDSIKSICNRKLIPLKYDKKDELWKIMVDKGAYEKTLKLFKRK